MLQTSNNLGYAEAGTFVFGTINLKNTTLEPQKCGIILNFKQVGHVSQVTWVTSESNKGVSTGASASVFQDPVLASWQCEHYKQYFRVAV